MTFEVTGKTLANTIREDEVRQLFFDWSVNSNPKQWPPKGDWTTWLLMGGRGSGKTRAGAEWVRGLVKQGVSPIALVGETIVEAIAVMVKGVSGIIRVTPLEERPRLRGHMLTWPNGVEAMILGAADPERFRGPQFAAAWCDELGKWKKGEAAWDMLQFGLRLGERPRQLVTTTPRTTALLKRIRAESGTVTVVMSTTDNRNHLAEAFFSAIVERYRNTPLGRQELEGELIEDAPDALWRREMFRRADAGARERTVVAVDPPATGGARADHCGIVVAARQGEDAAVLADLSFGPAHPDAWARRAVAAFHEFDADCIVAETNQGGDMVAAVIAQVDPDVPVRSVRAMRGKWLRAEPVAALYANGRVSHAAGLTELEDEMCALTPEGLAHGHSPDRVDALVWALTELLLGGREPRIRQT